MNVGLCPSFYKAPSVQAQGLFFQDFVSIYPHAKGLDFVVSKQHTLHSLSGLTIGISFSCSQRRQIIQTSIEAQIVTSQTET